MVGFKVGQAVVGSVRLRLGGDAYGRSGGGTEVGGGGGVYGQDRDGDGIKWWEDTVANLILGTDPNSPCASDLGLELHCPITSMLGGNGGRLERDMCTI